jgi:hypothetical protein
VIDDAREHLEVLRQVGGAANRGDGLDFLGVTMTTEVRVWVRASYRSADIFTTSNMKAAFVRYNFLVTNSLA